MEESVRELFLLKKNDIRSYSPLTLAFLGDAVYELVIRTYEVELGNRSSRKLHDACAGLAKASAQAAMARGLEESLTEEEKAVARRGRNSKIKHPSKSVDIQTYRKATGLECVFGFLSVMDRQDRIEELSDMIFMMRSGKE